MTREEVMKLAAGPETDELVATRVFGLKWEKTPRFSTDIGAALQVLDRIKNRFVRDDLAKGETLPLAICRFALLATLPTHN